MSIQPISSIKKGAFEEFKVPFSPPNSPKKRRRDLEINTSLLEDDDVSKITEVFNRAFIPIEGRRLTSPIPARLTPRSFFKNKKLEGLHQYLYEASIQNRKAPLSEDAQKEIRAEINEVIRKENDFQELISLLLILSQTVYCNTLDDFNKVLFKLTQKYPFLNNYFIIWENILKPKGISEILLYFEEEFGFEKGILSCKNHDEIISLIEQIAESKEDSFIRGWVAYNSDFVMEEHVTPVFLYKKQDTIKILITDSLGHNILDGKKEIKSPSILAKIIEIFKDRVDFFGKKLELYSLKTKRQRDEDSCSVFSLLDLKNLYERHLDKKDVFQGLEQGNVRRQITQEVVRNLKNNTSCLKVYEFFQLPFEMMKVTQSYSALSQYTQQDCNLVFSMPVFKRQSPAKAILEIEQTRAVLEQKTTEYKCFSKDGSPLNKYIERKKLGFINIIIAQALQKNLNNFSDS